MVGLGGVHVAVEEIHQDWTRLKNLAGAQAVLRDWETEWVETRVVDVRTFEDILETFGGRSSYLWCDFFARLPDGDVTANTSLEKLRSNVRLALCFLYDVGTILTRLRGAHALPPFWHTAIAAYNHVLEKQYDSVTIDVRAAKVVGKQS
jgi:hypothetical protein